MLTQNARMKRYFRMALLPVALLLLCLLLQLLELHALLRYDRDAILSGAFWRLFTGHFMHLGWSHLSLNLAGLLLVWLLFGALQSWKQWLLHWVFSALSVAFGLLWFNPELIWYVGLSGVLHGLFVAGVLTEVRYRKPLAVPVLLVFIAKLIWEQLYGPLPGSEQSAGGPVVVDAHLYGAVGGLISWLLCVIQQALKSP